MDRFAHAVIVLGGWRRIALAIGAGALSALAMAPLNLFPVLWLTLPVLVWLIDGAARRKNSGLIGRAIPAALVGWCFGFGYFVGGLWWIGTAFLVEADDFAWALPLAVTLLPAGLALFWAIGAAVARVFWTENWSRILVLAMSMSAAEWLRGHLLTGFPWNALGYALTPSALMMQSASIVGLWGLTLGAFLIFAAPAVLARTSHGSRRQGFAFLGFAAILFAAHIAFGGLRLMASEPADSGVAVRIVQPALSQAEKWDVANEEAIVTRYLELSDGASAPGRGGAGSAQILVWPESAFPFLLTDRPEVLAAIAALLPDGSTLVTGAARAEPNRLGEDGLPRVYNSVFVIDHEGEIVGAYDKVHLVPFGEYLPFRWLLEALGVRQLIALPGGFAPGAGRLTLTMEDAPAFSPLICYEIVFPGAVLGEGPRPGWLLNLTNDGWYGETPGPHQHLLQARVRAVEEGLPLVRAANSGISAIVDAHGRIESRLGVGRRGIVDGVLPGALPPTIYARAGDWVYFLLLIGMGGIVGVVQSSQKLRQIDKSRIAMLYRRSMSDKTASQRGARPF